MILLVSALMMLAPDDAIVRARGWAMKAKPIAQCTSGAECDIKWNRAKAWVRNNSRFNIVVDEPDLFSTPGAIYANTDLSYTLVMNIDAHNNGVIKAFAWCGNVLTCKPKPRRAVAELTVFIENP